MGFVFGDVVEQVLNILQGRSGLEKFVFNLLNDGIPLMGDRLEEEVMFTTKGVVEALALNLHMFQQFR